MPTPQNPGPSTPPAPNAQLQGPPPPDSGPTGWPPADQWPPARQRPVLDPRKSAERVREQLRLFLILILVVMVTSQLPLPFRLTAIAPALFALWTGIRLLALILNRRRADLGTRGWFVVMAGLGLTGVLLLMLVAEAAYYPLVADQERCTAGANTRTAQAACDQATKDRLNRLVGRLDDNANHP